MNLLALLAILRWERKVGVVALERMGVDIDAFAREVDQALAATCADIRQQSRAARVPDASVRSAGSGC